MAQNDVDKNGQEVTQFFSLNSDFDELTDKDRTVEIIGYVDEVTSTKVVGQAKKHRLFKFVFNNNNGKRIQCLIWNDNITDKESKILLNTIVHIDGAYCKACKLSYENESKNLVPFKLVIQTATVFNYLGVYGTKRSEPAFVVPRVVNFESIGSECGMITIHGYIKTKFVSTPSRYETSTYGCGSITDGTFKVTVQISNYQNLDFEKGQAVIVTGEINNQNDPLVIINCKTSSDVSIDVTKELMPSTQLIRGVETPKRKALP